MSSSDYVFGRGRSQGAAPADFIGGLTAGMTASERLDQVQFLARIMDEQFPVPGTNIRFGWDHPRALSRHRRRAYERDFAPHRSPCSANRRFACPIGANDRECRTRFPAREHSAGRRCF
jgi:hypothetical protein